MVCMILVRMVVMVTACYLLFFVTIGVEVLVRALVMGTDMVCHLLNLCESIVMFLLMVSLKTLEQLISEC